MSQTSYVEEFNKQLAAQLEVVRRAQPNHIPVYAMKYKNASKYLIQDLEEPLRLFPKKFKLQTIHEIIQKQSNTFSRTKLKEDSKVKAKGQLFEVPEFYLYTIELIQRKQSEETGGEQKSQRPIGTFVRLGLDMTFQEAFEKYGRQNVLTIVYTDATEVRSQSDRSAATKVEKWLTRVILFILFLVLVPYLMREQEPGFQTPLNSANTSHIDSHYVQDGPQIEQKAEDEDKLDIDVHLGDDFEFNEGKTIHYDEDNI